MAGKEASAISGAASGAAAGTQIMPGWGTAIGGAIGLIGGYLGHQDVKKQGDSAGTQAFNAVNIGLDPNAFRIKNADDYSNTARQRSDVGYQQSQLANQQRQALIGQLQQQAAGQGPSLATAQLKAAQDRTLAQQLAAAASRPQNATALGSRTLMRQQGEAGAQLAQQANQAQMQEALQAQQLLSQNVNQSEQLGSQLALQYMQQGFSVDQAQQQAQQTLQQLRVQQAIAAQAARQAALEASQRQGNSGLAGMLGGVGGLASGLMGAFGGGGGGGLADMGGTADSSLSGIGDMIG